MLVQEKAQAKEKKVTTMMKAVRIYHYGDSSVLKYEDAPIPDILPDEVLIRVHAAGVNPIDWKTREGYMKDAPFQFPLTLGWDVSGTIESTGSLNAIYKPGDLVIARPDTKRNGSYAEYAAVRAFEVAFAPTYLPLNDAAGVPLASQTAWMGLFEIGNLKKGQRVLIHGASGGVGTFAVQLAKIAGAYVISTTSSKNIDLVKSLGADEVIDYESKDFSKQVKDIDVVFDTVGKEMQQKSWELIRKNGILVSIVGTDEKAAEWHGVRTKSFMMISNGSRLQEIAGLIDKKMIRVIIAKEFPLSEAKEAQDFSKAGHVTGKIILEFRNKKVFKREACYGCCIDEKY